VHRSRITAANKTTTPAVRQAPQAIPKAWRAVWRACVDHLIKAGKYSHETDAPLVALYVHTLAEAESMRLQLDVEGRTVAASGDSIKAHPLCAQLNSARVTASKLAMSLGLAPAARVRISTAVDAGAHSEAPADPWAAEAKVPKPKGRGAQRLDA